MTDTPSAALRVLHGAGVRSQLVAARAGDALLPATGPPLAEGRLTVVVKTFERPRVVRRLVAGLARLHPQAHVIVVDDSRAPAPVAGAELIVLPYASGVSAGRQAGLDAVRTEFVSMFDDDFVLTRHSALGRAVAVLDAHLEIDLVGGRVVNLPRRRSIDYAQARLFGTPGQPARPAGSRIGGLPVFLKVPTFYVARTDRLRLVGWRPELKRLDHGDFFTRANGILVSVFDERMRCLHARTPYDHRYAAARADFEADRALLIERWPA